jgi:exonuclease III
MRLVGGFKRGSKWDFLVQYENMMEKIEETNSDFVLTGDMNIDLMRYGADAQVGEYVDQLVSSGLKFRIMQPTRVK